MLTPVRIPRPTAPPPDSAPLVAAYLAFDRRRLSRRQYMKAFGGMAILVLLGAAFGRVPADEAWIVSGLLASPPLCLAAAEAIEWRRLLHRRNWHRAESQNSRKS